MLSLHIQETSNLTATKKTILKQKKSDRKIHQPSHTRRRYVGWCQVSNTATTCPVRRRFASKTSSKLSLPAGVPSTIRRNWLFTKKPEPMKRKPHVSKEDRKFPLLFAKGNHWEIPILTDESDIFNKQKHLFLHGNPTCIMGRHLWGEKMERSKSNWKSTVYSTKSTCLMGTSPLLVGHPQSFFENCTILMGSANPKCSLGPPID